MVITILDEVNDQQILHHLYIILCHLYITIKNNNLHHDMWQLKKDFRKLFKK